jgi:uncharacterized membrane protein
MNPRDGGPGGDYGFGPMNHQFLVERGDHAGHGLGWVLMFIVLALIVALVVWVVFRVLASRAGGARFVSAPLDDALDVVRMRYARGEIDRKEYLRVSADLGPPLEPPLAPSA